MGIPDHLTCLLRNLYAGQEATEHGTMDWFQIGKGVCQGCHPAYLTYIEYNMWNARLDDSQAGIKILGRNINNLRYADDITLMAESEEELKSLLMRVKEESKTPGLKHTFKKLRWAFSPITLWQINGKKRKQWQILFFWAPKSLWIMNASMQLKDICSLEEKLWQT